MSAPRRGPRRVAALLAATTLAGCLFDFDSYDPRKQASPSDCPAAGAEESCYPGPSNTEGVGLCVAGSRICTESGWSACEGSVLPVSEDCLNDVDDDCDGDTDDDDDDCSCQPGELIACYDGASATLGVGACRRGHRPCEDPGAQCIGQVLPVLEACGNGIDEDCDGEVDEGCAVESACFHSAPEPQRPVAADAGDSGNVVFGGELMGDLSLGGSNLASTGDRDIFVAKFGSSAQHIWSRRFGGTLTDTLESLDVGGNGDVLLAGSYTGSWLFGSTMLPAYGTSRLAVWHLDADGDPTTVLLQGNSGGTSIALDAVGQNAANSYVVGTYASVLELGGEATGNQGATDGFVARYNRNTLAVAWLRTVGGSGEDDVSRVTFTATGDVAVAGQFSGAADLFGVPVSAVGSAANAFVARLSDTNGSPAFVEPFTSTGVVKIWGMEALGDDLVVVGHYGGALTVGTETLPTAQDVDPFVVRMRASDGSVVWARALTEPAGTPPATQRATAVSVDPSGDRIWVSIAIRGDLEADGQVVVASGDTSTARDDIVLWRLDGNGSSDLLLHFGDAQDQDTFALATMLDGRLFMGASVAGHIDFGAGPHTAGPFDPQDVCIALFPAP